MSRALKWIKDQFLHVLPAVVFFFVAFLVISFTTALMVRKHGITITTLPAIAFGALVVGKVVLVIDNLSFANAFSEKPLIYNTFWKTFIYSLAGIPVDRGTRAVHCSSRKGRDRIRVFPERTGLASLLGCPDLAGIAVFLFFAYSGIRTGNRSRPGAADVFRPVKEREGPS